jgi:hypothetical protein
MAMSAGTMISLASDEIIMGRQSQLGPIDPQMPVNGRFVSAIAIIDQFNEAKEEISKDTSLAHVWAPILASLGPALLMEAFNAKNYSEVIVASWIEKYMFRGEKDSEVKGNYIATYFSQGDSVKRSHGRRIDRDEARSVGVKVFDLESSQELQEAVLTLYHLITILFEKSPAAKIIATSNSKQWVKNSPF